jgi:hypothetical protein
MGEKTSSFGAKSRHGVIFDTEAGRNYGDYAMAGLKGKILLPLTATGQIALTFVPFRNCVSCRPSERG